MRKTVFSPAIPLGKAGWRRTKVAARVITRCRKYLNFRVMRKRKKKGMGGGHLRHPGAKGGSGQSHVALSSSVVSSLGKRKQNSCKEGEKMMMKYKGFLFRCRSVRFWVFITKYCACNGLKFGAFFMFIIIFFFFSFFAPGIGLKWKFQKLLHFGDWSYFINKSMYTCVVSTVLLPAWYLSAHTVSG